VCAFFNAVKAKYPTWPEVDDYAYNDIIKSVAKIAGYFWGYMDRDEHLIFMKLVFVAGNKVEELLAEQNGEHTGSVH